MCNILIVLEELVNYGNKEGKVAAFNLDAFRSINVQKTEHHKYLVVLSDESTWFGIKTCASEAEALQEIQSITQAYAAGTKVYHITYQVEIEKKEKKILSATGHAQRA